MFHHIYRFRRENVYSDDNIEVELIGDVVTALDYSLERHSHDKIEFCLVNKGKGYFYVDDKCYSVKQGDVFIALPGQMHYAKSDPLEPYRFYYFMFGISSESPIMHIFKELLEVKNCVVTDNYDIAHIFNMVIHELMGNLPASDIMLKSLIYEIVLLLHRNFCIDYRHYQIKINSKYELTQKIISYVDANIHKRLDLNSISKEIGYNSSYVSRVFKELLGLPLSAYITQEKMNKAKYLLENYKDMSITDAAYKAGFEDIHYFSKLYKKYFGISPSKSR